MFHALSVEDLADQVFFEETSCKTCYGTGEIEVDPQDEIDNQADLKHDDI